MATRQIGIRIPEDILDQLDERSKAEGRDRTSIVLDSIKARPWVSVTDRRNLPEIPAVYIVWTDNRLLYVGQTRDLNTRFKQHHRLGQFLESDGRVSWFDAQDGDDVNRLEVESELIEALEPELNGESNPYNELKGQAYSFAFPPDKKQAFTKIADEKYQRPASWLLLQAIDQVIANGGLLGEEPSPAPKASPPLVHIDIDEASKVYASKADLSDVLSEYVQKNSWDDLRADVADLREQLTKIKGASVSTHTDFDPAAIQIYIDQQIEELRAQITAIGAKLASIGTTGNPSQKAKAATTAQDAEIQKWVRRLEAKPELRAAIEEGLNQNLTGKVLTEWVFSKGFGANENTKAFDSSVSARMRGAIEYLNRGQG